MHSVRLEPTKLILIDRHADHLYQATAGTPALWPPRNSDLFLFKIVCESEVVSPPPEDDLTGQIAHDVCTMMMIDVCTVPTWYVFCFLSPSPRSINHNK